MGEAQGVRDRHLAEMERLGERWIHYRVLRDFEAMVLIEAQLGDAERASRRAEDRIKRLEKRARAA